MSGYDRPKLEVELIRDEGLILNRTYRCTAEALTAGVGRNLDANPLTKDECRQLGTTNAFVRLQGVDRRGALILLRNDIAGCERDLDRALPWWRSLEDVRQRVLLNMCFNLGITRLLGFKNTLEAVRTRRWSAAAVGMRASLWARQVGARADRLAAMMLSGTAK